MSTEKTALENELRNQSATIDGQTIQISRLTSSSSRFEAQVADVTKQLTAANAENDRIREEIRSISAQISSLQSLNEDYRRRLAGCPFHSSVSFD